MTNYNDPVLMIPINEINIVNTRSRGKDKFTEIIRSIKQLGLKKPITVAPAKGKHGPRKYDLVCGEGRILAFQSLGETIIPARVQELNNEEILLMSLVENLARRSKRSAEILKEVQNLKSRGYTVTQIAAKTALTNQYISGVLRLLATGEKELLQAVERRQIPISVAVEIAVSDDEQVQRVLRDAYEKNLFRGQELLKVRKFIEQRRIRMEGGLGQHKEAATILTSRKMLQAYKDEATRQQAIVKQANLCQRHILYVVAALKRLLADESFVTLLRAESLDELPKFLAKQVL